MPTGYRSLPRQGGRQLPEEGQISRRPVVIGADALSRLLLEAEHHYPLGGIVDTTELNHPAIIALRVAASREAQVLPCTSTEKSV